MQSYFPFVRQLLKFVYMYEESTWMTGGGERDDGAGSRAEGDAGVSSDSLALILTVGLGLVRGRGAGAGAILVSPCWSCMKNC